MRTSPKAARFALIALATLGTACGRDPVQPTAVPPASYGPPAVECPANVSVAGLGNVSPVDYSAPRVVRGAPPVEVACDPASGAAFPVGSTTTVNCNASDNFGRDTACSFTVTVTPIVLGATRFLAFGDSVTEGENGLSLTAARVLFLDLPNAYPTLVEASLRNDFPRQNVRVINEGLGGERVTEGIGRFTAALNVHQPDAVLLLDGYNDLIHDGAGASAPIADALRQCVRIARGRGIQPVFVSTITPPGPGRRALPIAAVVQTNVLIAQMVASEGAYLVNPFDFFIGHEEEYVADGLHLSPAGNRVLADTFLAVIKERLIRQP
jgi:lysophospholipase L1-like esterase